MKKTVLLLAIIVLQGCSKLPDTGDDATAIENLQKRWQSAVLQMSSAEAMIPIIDREAQEICKKRNKVWRLQSLAVPSCYDAPPVQAPPIPPVK